MLLAWTAIIVFGCPLFGEMTWYQPLIGVPGWGLG